MGILIYWLIYDYYTCGYDEGCLCKDLLVWIVICKVFEIVDLFINAGLSSQVFDKYFCLWDDVNLNRNYSFLCDYTAVSSGLFSLGIWMVISKTPKLITLLC